MKGNVKSIVLRAGVGLAFMFAAGAAYAGPGCCGSKQDATVKKVEVKSSDGLKAQEVCPIMGGKIKKDVFVDVAGYRFYACCPSCLPKIKADPEAALKTLKEKGQKPELLADAKKCTKSCDKKCDSAKSGKDGAKSKCGSSCSKDGEKKSCSKSCGSDSKADAKSAAKCCSGDKKAEAKCCGSKDKAAAKSCPSKGSCSGKDAKAKSCSSDKCGDKSPCTGKSCKGSDACKGSEKVALCDKCGALAGEKDCCKGTGTKCDTCGLIKRSPECCKVSKPAEPVKS